MGRADMFSGLFKGLFRSRSSRDSGESAADDLNVLLHGRDSYAFEVAGCARHQAEIRAIMADKAQGERRRKCIAALFLDQATNSGAPRVGVVIDGTLIGYFPRYLSTQYCEWLKAWRLSGARVHCHALILGDRSNTGPDGVEHRIKLDIEIPFKMTAIQS